MAETQTARSSGANRPDYGHQGVLVSTDWIAPHASIEPGSGPTV